jgi:PAS domain S-box-containing protein
MGGGDGLLTDDGSAGQAQIQNGWRHFDLAERAARFGYWRTQLADGKTFWSGGMYRLLGVDPASQAPDSDWLLEQIEPADVDELRRRIEAAIKSRSSFSYRTRSKSPGTAAQIVDTVGEVELGSDGRVIAVVGVCTDVTAQVTAEAERETARERYRVMADEASDIIALIEDDRMVCVSSALQRLLGRQPEDLQHGRYLSLVHPDDMEEAKKLEGRPAPGETRTAAYRLRHADGQYVWFETTTRGVYDVATGAFRKEIAVGRDISDRKKQEAEMRAAQERAEAANRAKSLFLANMSHELRTPLNAIMGFTDMMCQRVFGALGSVRYEEYAEKIHDSAKQLLEQISNVLEVANIEAGLLELAPEPLDLVEVIDVCRWETAASAKAKGLSLTVNAEGSCLSLVADRRAVKQILLQLLSNAVKFTPPGGHVSIEAGLVGANVSVVVRDDGVGIPESELPRLGKPFEQACAERYLTKNGQGLGLALVTALTEKHGGAIRIESRSGEGTAVHLELPVANARGAAA